jgi:hypothetical protein
MTKQTKWKLAISVFGLPFVVATGAYLSRMSGAPTFAEWAGFVESLAQWVLGLYAACDVLHKGVLAKLAPQESHKDGPSA